jgi:Gamma tubulin complex component N-terminal
MLKEVNGDSFSIGEGDKRDQSELLMLDKIKPADRDTFLLNYLYITIRNNQLLEVPESHVLTEIFLCCLDSYIGILSDWVSKGELNDPRNEFFIKANPKVFENLAPLPAGKEYEKMSSKNQWR